MICEKIIQESVMKFSSPFPSSASPAVFATKSGWWVACLLLAGLVSSQAQLPVTDGVALWLKADAGVSTNASGQVTAWLDQSSNQNNAQQRTDGTTSELPRWLAGAVNGKPAVQFDGLSNVLEIVNSPSLQPQANDWTVFFVAKRLAASQGDYPQIIGSRPWVAGLDKGWAVTLDSSGAVCSHLADGTTGHDAPDERSVGKLATDSYQMWQVEENLAARTTSFYRNGDIDAVRNSTMPAGVVDQTDSIYLGREIGGSNNRRANMDLAEVIIYSRVLSKADRDSVANYLSGKYDLGYAPNVLPTVSVSSPTNGATFAAPLTLTLTAVAADSDGTVRRVDFYENGNLLASASAPPFSLPLNIQSTGAVSFVAVAVDNRNGISTSAPVAITLTGNLPMPPMDVNNGLALWLKADAGVTADASGSVSAWSDQSANANMATQDNSGATPPDSYQPLLVADAFHNQPAIRFDGVNDFMRIANSPSLQPQSGDWTVFFVGERGANSQGDFPQIIGSRPWATGTDLGWSVSFNRASGLVGSHFADDGQGHDVGAAAAATPLSLTTFQVWQVEEDRAQATTRFYLAGQTNRILTTVMPTNAINQANDVYLGSEIEGGDTRRANLDLAEVLVFNRVLPTADRDQVTSYLLRKYAVEQVFNVNQAPSVALTSPAAGTVFNAPAKLALQATASDADGAVTRVEFFSGPTSLGFATNSPFAVHTAITALGNLTLTAVATDNLGTVSTSAPVVVKIIAPGIQLVGQADYSDSFTTNATRTDTLYNDNSKGAYSVENAYTNPAATWTPTGNFSFNTPGSSTAPATLGAAQGNTGAALGFAQSGGSDFSIAYGRQSNYVVQVDAILPTDRLDITSLSSAGGGIFAANSLSIFLRRDTVTAAPGIGLFNGTKETGVTNASGALVRTGVADDHWHTYAIRFDQVNHILKVYVDGVILTTLDLATFAGGIYQNYSNGAVGVGGAGGVFWMDNFKVGPPPELITTVDYSDAFTFTDARTDGLYNDNSAGAYSVENTYGNPAADWTPTSNFSFNSPASSTDPTRLLASLGNVGADTGLAQSGGGDFSITYGMRSNYVVQLDAILPTDRLDITSLPTAGGGIGSANSLSVFFRRDSTAGTPHAAFPDTGLPAMGLYNGNKETAVVDPSGALIFTGVDDNDWHNFAMQFDQPANVLRIYVDRTLKVTVDLATYAGAIYQNYSNGAVGMGGAGGVFWMDNFKVGAPAVVTPTPSRLTIVRDQNNVTVSWTGTGALEQAPSLSGPWTAVPGATSPQSIPITAQRQFYRVRN